jgi:hypothetical protein
VRDLVGESMIEEFIKERWDMLPDKLKVAVACRYLELPYYTNIVKETCIDKRQVLTYIFQLVDIGSVKESWEKADNRWVKCFKYDDHCTNDFIDKVILEMMKDT